MTVLPRGARNRRGGRRPGWVLLTVLLFLAIVASSALVFTNRAELLKLAVVLSLWAAIIAAFVSVVYRRQSDADQARARDLKLVYDLQLDREISARREYELSVESHLRRELSHELRAQAADEVAALRSELAALRANLEILFDADLGARPALEGERGSKPDYGDWTRDTTTIPSVPGRVESSRITPVGSDQADADDGGPEDTESPIIDVPEEPLAPSPPPAAAQPQRRRRRAASTDSHGPPAPQPVPQHNEWVAPPMWAPIGAEAEFLPPPYASPPLPHPAEPPPPTPRARHRTAQETEQPDPEPVGQHADGQSVAELMARLQVDGRGAGGGGRRRARED